MKTVYLVRHGEATINVGSQRFEGAQSTLTQKGQGQAQKIAERAARLSFDALITSPYIRTKQTAEIVAAKTGHEIEFSELFTETRHPTYLTGMASDDPEVGRAMRAQRESLFSNGPREDDGETFEELHARAVAALVFLEQHAAERLLVVTHGMFLRMLISHVLFGDELTAHNFSRIVAGTRTVNTGITLLTHEGPAHMHELDQANRWRLIAYNDHAHLG